jgi:glycine cleavage system aminomethyltransferase T
MSYFGKFFLVGPDATKAAQYIFTNDINKPPGSVIYTCILNKKGGIEADLTVTVLDEKHCLDEDPKFSVKKSLLTKKNKKTSTSSSFLGARILSCSGWINWTLHVGYNSIYYSITKF